MKRILITMVTATFCLSAQAQQARKLVNVKKTADWKELAQPTKMEVGPIYYNQAVAAYKTWEDKRPIEFRHLNLFSGYKEPEIEVLRNGIKREAHIEEIRVISSKTRLVLNKAAESIDLTKLLDEKTYSELMSDMKHRFISNNEIMPVIAGPDASQAFSHCVPAGDKSSKLAYFSRQQKEKKETLTKNVGRNWCNNPNSKCVRSCVAFQEGDRYYNSVLTENGKRILSGSERLLDFGMAIESELRVFKDEAEYGSSVTDLTGLSEPVLGIFQQSIYYWDQMVEFGKVITVVQAHPSDPGKAVVTSSFIIGVKESSFGKVPFLMDHLNGEFNNTEHGITAGIPKYTQEFASRLADYFER